MPTAGEGAGVQGQQQAVLDAGIDQLSADGSVVFTAYSKVALSPDSSVFWVATQQTVTVRGSLHYATDRRMDEDETLAAQHVVLTAETEITQFAQVAPTQLWIGNWPVGGGPALMIAFSSRGAYYQEANLWHYSGYAVFPALQSQLVQTAADLPTGPIVSNSLPIWLSLGTFQAGTEMVTVPVYPSFLVPDNIVPPYVVAHVEPMMTEVLANWPIYAWPGTLEPDTGASPLYAQAGTQLARDEVMLTLYGFPNALAWQYWVNLVETSQLNTLFGFANSPVLRDAKRGQSEIGALAQKKTLRILANYYQGAADVIARRLILAVGSPTVTVVGGV